MHLHDMKLSTYLESLVDYKYHINQNKIVADYMSTIRVLLSYVFDSVRNTIVPHFSWFMENIPTNRVVA